MTALAPELRGVGMVFQNYALYPHLTVLQNILFPLENLKGKDRPSREERKARALEAAKLVQIEELLDPEAQGALRRAAAAGGHRPGAGKDPPGAAAGRAPL